MASVVGLERAGTSVLALVSSAPTKPRITPSRNRPLVANGDIAGPAMAVTCAARGPGEVFRQHALHDLHEPCATYRRRRPIAPLRSLRTAHGAPPTEAAAANERLYAVVYVFPLPPVRALCAIVEILPGGPDCRSMPETGQDRLLLSFSAVFYETSNRCSGLQEWPLPSPVALRTAAGGGFVGVDLQPEARRRPARSSSAPPADVGRRPVPTRATLLAYHVLAAEHRAEDTRDDVREPRRANFN